MKTGVWTLKTKLLILNIVRADDRNAVKSKKLKLSTRFKQRKNIKVSDNTSNNAIVLITGYLIVKYF